MFNLFCFVLCIFLFCFWRMLLYYQLNSILVKWRHQVWGQDFEWVRALKIVTRVRARTFFSAPPQICVYVGPQKFRWGANFSSLFFNKSRHQKYLLRTKVSDLWRWVANKQFSMWGEALRWGWARWCASMGWGAFSEPRTRLMNKVPLYSLSKR